MTTAATAQLAAWVADARYDRLPPRVVGESKNLILDWFGSCLAGADADAARILRAVVEEQGGAPQATLLPGYGRTSALLAAFANAGTSHIREMDDVHRGAIFHPAAPIIPTALALAERDDADGRALITAVVAGYEVGIRVGEALGPAHYDRHHTTGTAGVLGAAAAASSLLGLDAATVQQALGSAGTQSAGIWEFMADGAMSKQLHPAKAAHDGLLSALLAQQGFSAASRILEGEQGLLASLSPEPRPHHLNDGLAADQSHYRVSETSYKPHASCRHTHPAVDAALALAPQVDLEAIERIDVRVYSRAMDLLAVTDASTPRAARFNLPYCVATALAHRDLSMPRFAEEALTDPTVRRLMDLVQIDTDADYDRRWPAQWPSAVVLHLRDGRSLREEVENPKGDPENPLSSAEIAAKFRTMADPAVGAERAQACQEAVLALDTGVSARDLVAALRVPVAA